MVDWIIEAVTSLFGAIFDVVMDIFTYIFYWVFCLIGEVADLIQALFRAFSGLGTTAALGGYYTDDVYFMFQETRITNVLISMGVLAILLLIITTAIAVVKSEFVGLSEKGGNSKTKIIGQSLKSLVNIFAVPVCCMLAVVGVNAVLRAVDSITAGGENVSLARQVFVSIAYSGNKCRLESDGDGDDTCTPENYAALLSAGVNSFGINFDDYSGAALGTDSTEEYYAAIIDYLFLNNVGFGENYVTMDRDTKSSATNLEKNPLDQDEINQLANGDFNGKTFVIAVQGGKGLGLNKNRLMRATSFDYTNKAVVKVFYHLGEFNIIAALVAIIMVAFNMLTMVLTCIKRIFELVILFAISPPIAALTPLDGGSAIKNWRQTFVASLLSLFGPIIAINMVFMVLPMVFEIDFLGSIGLRAATDAAGLKGLESMAKILITCAAVSYIKDLSGSLSKILGANNAADTDGAVKGFSKNVKAARATGKALGAAAAAPVKAIGGGIMSAAKGEGFGKGVRNSLLNSADSVAGNAVGAFNEAAGTKFNTKNVATNALDNMKARAYKAGAFGAAITGADKDTIEDIEARGDAHESAVKERGMDAQTKALHGILGELTGNDPGYESKNGKLKAKKGKIGISANVAKSTADIAHISQNSDAQAQDIHQIRQTVGHESDFDPNAFLPDGTLRRGYNGPGSNTILGQSGRTAGRAEDSIRETRRQGRVLDDIQTETHNHTAALDDINRKT